MINKINKIILNISILVVIFLFILINSKNVLSADKLLVEEIFDIHPEIVKIVTKSIVQAIKEDETAYIQATSNSIVSPPSLESPNAHGYYKMPTAPSGAYLFGGWNTCESHRYGSKTLIDAIYTAALKWKAKYPQYTFRIGDLNGATIKQYPGRGHSSHGNGVDVDIVTYGNWSIQINAPVEVNIDLGKAFIDTGVIKLIIFGGATYNPNAPIVQNAWKTYANSKGLPFQTYSYGNHDNHFHIRINDQYRLAEYRPAPCQ